jgi:D-glycerate 3-kinase
MDREEFWDNLGRWIYPLVRASAARPLIVGLSAPQGAGKTTLTRELTRRAVLDGLHATSISIDDFYLTRSEQVALAQRFPDNPYLQQRGYPGTHDIALGTRTLAALEAIGANGRVALPAYDKTRWHGAGDRRPEQDWTVVEGPLDLVLFEGWMLGFTPIAPDSIDDPHLRLINERLSGYAPWLYLVDAFVWLEPADPEFVIEWRAEAERRSREEGHPGMSEEAVRDFAGRFLPAYRTYLPHLRCETLPQPCLHLVIGRDRLPLPD